MFARPRVWGGVLAACVLATVGGTAAGSTRSAVLQGNVLLAPATPVCMPRVPCIKPAGNVVLRFVRRGVVRARVKTAADGSYRLELAPGMYAVRAAGRLTPPTVAVSAGQVKRVTFYMDTGIR